MSVLVNLVKFQKVIFLPEIEVKNPVSRFSFRRFSML